MEVVLVELPIGWLDHGEEVAHAQRTAEGKNEIRQQVFAEKHANSMPGPQGPSLLRETMEMGFHHVALATRDAAATHAFYTQVMGFELVKVHVGPTPNPGNGFSKHFFYATNTDVDDDAAGDRGTAKDLIAFWELKCDDIGDNYEVNINKAAGLPSWVNHIAFDAPTREALDRHRVRWQQHGHRVLEVDHGFCTSIYLEDPSGNMVEFCLTTREFTDDERSAAEQLLVDLQPDFEADPTMIVHEPLTLI